MPSLAGLAGKLTASLPDTAVFNVYGPTETTIWSAARRALMATLPELYREIRQQGLEKPDDALVFAIVTVPAEAGTVTANLMGPVIVNRANRKGMQAVLTDPR